MARVEIVPLPGLPDDSDLLGLMAHLHRGYLVRLQCHGGRKFQGLAAGGRALEMSSTWRRRLAHIDWAYGMLRKLSQVSVTVAFKDLEAELNVAKISGDAPSTPTDSDFQAEQGVCGDRDWPGFHDRELKHGGGGQSFPETVAPTVDFDAVIQQVDATLKQLKDDFSAQVHGIHEWCDAKFAVIDTTIKQLGVEGLSLGVQEVTKDFVSLSYDFPEVKGDFTGLSEGLQRDIAGLTKEGYGFILYALLYTRSHMYTIPHVCSYICVK